MFQNIKKRLYEILEKASPGDKQSRAFQIFIISLIFLNVIAVILETVESLALQFGNLFQIFEILSVSIFSIEFILRIWSITNEEKFSNPIFGRIKFIFTPFAIIDLIAIIPFYLPMIFPLDLRFIRILRVFRIFRLLKLGRYANSLRLLVKVINSKKEELLITVFALSILIVIASSLIFFAEHDAQPKSFSNILASMWWAVATLSTVGYGDIYPITSIGKIVGAIIAVFGIALFALPAGIIASGFVEEFQNIKKEEKICPHCGKTIN